MLYNRCEICRTYLLADDPAVHFQVKNRVPTLVDLGGRAPWSGVRCICARCAVFLGRAVQPSIADPAEEKS
jgi:hypothetical protein